MTSSLVGSEMCIRDSCKGGPRCRSRQSLTLRAPCNHSAAAQVAPVPVSYTHLTLPTICSV
eukprot:11910815-Prorocentrum_lima.AAC.1